MENGNGVDRSDRMLLQSHLLAAGTILTRMNASQRAGWTIFLLELLDEDSEFFSEFLLRVAAAIERRMQTGAW